MNLPKADSPALYAASRWDDPVRLRRKANAIRVEAFSFPHPPASYFLEAQTLDRRADLLERVEADRA